MKKILAILLALLLILPLASVRAADEAITVPSAAEAQGDVSVEAIAENVDGGTNAVGELEGVEMDVIEKVPSNLGLWWRDARENLSLIFTWNELSKAEKELRFAEERMRIAKLIAEQNPDDVQAQTKARKMIDRAQKLMDKVEARQDRWGKDKDAGRVGRFVKNLATHEANSDVILDELESRLPADEAEKIAEKRQEIAERSQRLLNALSNENLSDEQKAHLEGIKGRIEDHLSELRKYNEERKALAEKVQAGDESAKADLQALRKERQTRIQVRTEAIEEIKAGLEQDAAAGDAMAQKKLEMIDKIQQAKEATQERSREEAQSGVGPGSGQAARDGQTQAITDKIKDSLDQGSQNGQSGQ